MNPVIIDAARWQEMKSLVLQAIGWLEDIILFDITFSDGHNIRISLWAFLFSAFCFAVVWSGFVSLYQQGADTDD